MVFSAGSVLSERLQNSKRRLNETNEGSTFYLLLALVCSESEVIVGADNHTRHAGYWRAAIARLLLFPPPTQTRSEGSACGHFLFYVFVSLSFCSVIFPLFSLLFACCVHISTNVTPERANHARVDGNLRE